MSKRYLFILPLLAACGTPQERCILRETRDLRNVDKLIAETEANITRGYALEQVTVYHTEWQICDVQPVVPTPPGTRPPAPKMCLEDVPETVTKPKAINLANERQTLVELKKKRVELSRQANASIAQCKAEHPE